MIKYGYEIIADEILNAGFEFLYSYPGFPCIEIFNNIFNRNLIYCENSINEKVALESSAGASLGGKRSISIMKTVGLNVAADPLVALSGSKINAALVVLVCDDVGRSAGDDLSDSREYAKNLEIPYFVPTSVSDVGACLQLATKISEKNNCLVMVRLTSTITHTLTNRKIEIRTGKKNQQNHFKYKYFPKTVNASFVDLNEEEKYDDFTLNYDERINEVLETVLESNISFYKEGDDDRLFVTSGICTQIILELYPNSTVYAPICEFPLNTEFIKNLVNNHSKSYIFEEAKDVLETSLMLKGIKFSNFQNLYNKETKVNAITPQIIKHTVNSYEKSIKKQNKNTDNFEFEIKKPGFRNPVLCTGCSHRIVMSLLKDNEFKVIGDSGCFTLSIFPSLNSIDIFTAMGTSTGIINGFKNTQSKVAAVLGDGGIIHGGFNSLLNSVINKATGLLVILDNDCLAMTGGLSSPSRQRATIENIMAAYQLEYNEIDAFNIDKLAKYLKNYKETSKLEVLIIKSPCILVENVINNKRIVYNKKKCIKCLKCLQLNCMGICLSRSGEIIINKDCNSCGLCTKKCYSQALNEVSCYEK